MLPTLSCEASASRKMLRRRRRRIQDESALIDHWISPLCAGSRTKQRNPSNNTSMSPTHHEWRFRADSVRCAASGDLHLRADFATPHDCCRHWHGGKGAFGHDLLLPLLPAHGLRSRRLRSSSFSIAAASPIPTSGGTCATPKRWSSNMLSFARTFIPSPPQARAGSTRHG